ncbi:bifunctional [glutamate--ammonia ligase]-adenylyl-L-tyrosine phosphorylase/[glutamate--ammonia-ligase] adenylyltransferase [Methylomonas sp. MO1]|uniref:bifunctional [glutamate--ammonia ligase]-adenylyl-L-tyrosine phosphorylase/[glutamate--ammonia-ligase] adenylyltransferase n=1 Tax=unclassified Methylomonas TaxID=2608980 RepID=UPI00055B391D|nr:MULTISPECIES: bifunctional [glutamate--ammonia ligase]-adenylyl-L-tyrosine phosphorylase/[glutamate--ammonia-ligase] adenylyltransferase [unclassified Methylomonas]MDT4290483.1 bifunctional [glutamate--ammonia ligase]-adenylyl-L-tyrosine phosphorylase/[glutamate--ammonia-ligase] adenylyltransferase [Methylomonas sp. MO1]
MSLLDSLSQHTVMLPDELRTLAADFCSQLDEKLSQEQRQIFDNEVFSASVLKVCVCSQFISENWLRNPDLIPDLVTSTDLFAPLRSADYAAALQQSGYAEGEPALAKQLRLFRRREMIRIAWRDLAGWSDLDETLTDLTALAEACIQTALDFLYRQACARWGTPTLADGTPFNIVVLGMGKLGAWELNYSSDIDLIFAYAEDGVLTEKKEISYGEFFTRICRSLVKMLDEITVDGFVFRTDVRLRPFGDSGPLIMNFDGMEQYYLTQAREWERYAMIKARQVAGDFHTGKQLAALIKPFVYRRYLDYGAFEELRSLKFQIAQELKRRDRADNVKLGPGGIREVEFIGQAFQLIRGGQDVALQQREIQTVLTVLEELGLMIVEDVATLKFAYRFLRRVENHIQQYQDKQTHDLPANPLVQRILSYSLDFEDWGAFKAELDQVRASVQDIFEQVFSLSEQDNKQQSARLIWTSPADNELALEALADYGFTDPLSIQKALVDFKESHAIKRMTSKGAGVLDRLMPQLIEQVANSENSDATLLRILDLFEAVAGRNVYLALLAENPDALNQLINLAAASPWICEYLSLYPILFDELLDTRSLYDPLQKQALREDLQRELARVDTQDSEQLMIALRQFKHLNVLRVAAADIMGVIPVMIVSDYLTWTAEAILEQVLQCAWHMLVSKHGHPPGTGPNPQNFAIIAFGKFGGIELGYGSDLDLVFLYACADGDAQTNGEKPINSGQFYLRLGQKIRHILDTKMLSGILYEADLRLRPNGDSGLLVTHIDHYEAYLKNEAWTWEHQALVRGRFVAGDENLKHSYEAIRGRILALPRDREELKTQVREMREKMRDNLAPKDPAVFDLKQSQGGIADIEFIVQFGVLAETAQQPSLATYTDNVRLLEGLQQHGFISPTDAALLKRAYCAYRDYGHHQVLQGLSATAHGDDFHELRAEVERIWQQFML